ncbi:MAG: hypothetical protein O3A46_00715 [Candidatus Poribacteria bacterium]|nr:hypothetical protein [Candidatus Poribacteria bacterium]
MTMLEQTTRDEVLELVNELNESDLYAAKQFLRFLATQSASSERDDLDDVPLDDEEWSDEDLAAIEEGRADMLAGRVISNEEIKRRLDTP